MAPTSGESQVITVDDLMWLETRVLKTLCLTINTAGSELKYKILDSLSHQDFFFPITRAVFQTLSEMHRAGDYVISASIAEELEKAHVEVPVDFPLDYLFRGELPPLAELDTWVVKMKERSEAGIEPVAASVRRHRPRSRSDEPKSDPDVLDNSANVDTIISPLTSLRDWFHDDAPPAAAKPKAKPQAAFWPSPETSGP